MTASPVQTSDLHAYVDGELSAARRAELTAWLNDHPEERVRVESYRRQKDDIRQLFAPVLDEPLPDCLTTLADQAPPSPVRAGSGRFLQRLAAGLAIAFVSGASGWLAHDLYRPPVTLAQLSPLPRQAAIAHAVFSPDVRRPVEISAEHEDQLIAWLSKRLGAPIRPPRLGGLGYELVGGRLLPGDTGPVAQFMYQDASGERLTLYVGTENTSNRDTAFRFAQEGSVNVFYWIDGKFGYAISAGVPKDALARVATAVYEQLQKE